MVCTPAPACKAMLSQATTMFPNRSKLSDGVCPGPNHPPTGDHPNGEAVDLTHDPGHGCDVDVLYARIVERRDPRVKYLIRNRRILRSYDKPGIPAWTWAPYTGDNPHDKHGHCSILPGARDNVSAWFGVAPPPIPQPEPEENDMAFIYVDKTGQDQGQVYDSGSTLVKIPTGEDAQALRDAGVKEVKLSHQMWATLNKEAEG